MSNIETSIVAVRLSSDSYNYHEHYQNVFYIMNSKNI